MYAPQETIKQKQRTKTRQSSRNLDAVWGAPMSTVMLEEMEEYERGEMTKACQVALLIDFEICSGSGSDWSEDIHDQVKQLVCEKAKILDIDNEVDDDVIKTSIEVTLKCISVFSCLQDIENVVENDKEKLFKIKAITRKTVMSGKPSRCLNISISPNPL